MDEAEHCQRIGFIHRGKLLAVGSPSELKAGHMYGQVLRVSASDPTGAARVLQQAQQQGRLESDEVALYGAQLHVVVPCAEEARPLVASLLASEGITVRSVEWIAPSLEDVFISCVRDSEIRSQDDRASKQGLC
jgi:ABC-2 type transport system ATP-binding protein